MNEGSLSDGERPKRLKVVPREELLSKLFRATEVFGQQPELFNDAEQADQQINCLENLKTLTNLLPPDVTINDDQYLVLRQQFEDFLKGNG